MRDIGHQASIVAKKLWPELVFYCKGSAKDRSGTDAVLNRHNVQIKGDIRIIQSGNIYHEVYEKTKGRPEQEWRHSPNNADLYIFVTWDSSSSIAYMITIDMLAIAEQNLPLRQISNTSIGFLIPLSKIIVMDTKIGKL